MSSFKLKLSLLRIWILKNLFVFIELALIIVITVFFILGFTSAYNGSGTFYFINENLVIDETTGLATSGDIVFLLWPIGSIIGAIRNVFSGTGGVGTALTACSFGFFSLVSSIGAMSKNLKTIALKDIKSNKLKRAIAMAGYFFDKDGKLTKKIEKGAKIDIDGDGKAGDIDMDSLAKENFFAGAKRSISEIWTILTSKIDTEKESVYVEKKLDLEKTGDILLEGENPIVENIEEAVKNAPTKEVLAVATPTISVSNEEIATVIATEEAAIESEKYLKKEVKEEISKEEKPVFSNFFSSFIEKIKESRKNKKERREQAKKELVSDEIAEKIDNIDEIKPEEKTIVATTEIDIEPVKAQEEIIAKEIERKNFLDKKVVAPAPTSAEFHATSNTSTSDLIANLRNKKR